MTKTEIQRASDAELRRRLEAIDAEMPSDPDLQDTLQWEGDAIEEELEKRAHDVEDPSSGLGCHEPT